MNVILSHVHFNIASHSIRMQFKSSIESIQLVSVQIFIKYNNCADIKIKEKNNINYFEYLLFCQNDEKKNALKYSIKCTAQIYIDVCTCKMFKLCMNSQLHVQLKRIIFLFKLSSYVFNFIAIFPPFFHSFYSIRSQ